MKFKEPSIFKEEIAKLNVEQALDRAISAQLKIMKAKLELKLIVRTHYYDLSNYWIGINKNDPNYENKHLLQKIGDFANFNIDLLNK